MPRPGDSLFTRDARQTGNNRISGCIVSIHEISDGRVEGDRRGTGGGTERKKGTRKKKEKMEKERRDQRGF